MNNEYIIVNKTLLEKRIEELEKERVLHEKVDIGMFDPVWAAKTSQAIDLLIEILSLSTPLLPEIKKSYDVGSYNHHSQYTEKYDTLKQLYISNLKLDI